MNTEMILRRTVIGLIFVIPFIPFIVATPFFFPFITGKNFAFRIIVELAFALWAILALRDAAVRPRSSALLIAVLLFVVSLGFSTFFGENPSKSFWSNFERMEGWIGILHLGAYFVVLTSMFRGEKLWRTFWNVSIGVSAALGVYGLFQLAGVFDINQGGVRVDATFGNATYLAIYMLFHVFLTILAMTRWTKDTWLRMCYGIALALQILMIFFAATRGTTLGLIGGLLLTGLILVLFARGQRRLRQWGAGVAVFVVLMVGGFILIKDSSFVQESEVLSRFASISLSEGSTRFTIWNMAIQGALERPVFGWGQEGFNYIFNERYDPALYTQEQWFDRAHNQYLDWLVAGGFAAFFLYLSFYAIVLWYLARSRNGKYSFDLVEGALFVGLIAGYGFHNLFVFDNLMSSVLFYAILAYLGYRAIPAEEKKPVREAPTLSGTAWYGASSGIALIACLVFYFGNVPGIARANNLIEGLKPQCVTQTGTSILCTSDQAARQDLGLNWGYFQKASSGGGLGRQEAREQLMQFALKIREADLAPLTSDELKLEVIEGTVMAIADEASRAPNDARISFFQGSFLHQLGNFEAAQIPLLKAHELSPGKQAIIFELGFLALDAGKGDEALDWLKQAYELEPKYEQAAIYYAAALIRLGKGDVASTILIERFGTDTPDDNTIAQSYYVARNLAKVVAIFEARVSDTDDAQDFLDLAVVYVEMGRRTDAVAAIREAIRIKPDLAEQGEQYINQIEGGQI